MPDKDSEEYLDRNIVKRYSDSTDYWQTVFDYDKKEKELKQVDENTGLVLIKSPCLDNVQSLQTIQAYEKEVIRFIRDNVVHIKKGGFVVIQTRDIRINGYVEPLAKRFVEKLSIEGMWLKEIIIITRNGDNSKQPLLPNGNLDITHQYLLVYEVLKSSMM